MKLLINIFILYLFLFSNLIFAQSDTTEIIILHTNDTHAKIDNYSKLAYLTDQYRREYKYVFLVSAGDIFTGNPIVDQYTERGFPIIDLMNKTAYDISCIGNHEFDYGQKQLDKHIKQSNFPYVSANIHCSEISELEQPTAYYKLYTSDSISIGIVGLIQIERNNYPATNHNRLTGLKFSDPLKTIKKYKTYKDSSDIFIGLTHLGIGQDKKLAKKFPYFDVIIGGHSHTILQSGIIENITLIAHAGSNMNFLGVLKLKLVNNKLVDKSASLINMNEIENSKPEIDSLIKMYNKNPDFDLIIGHTTNDIRGIDELGSLMTDAVTDTLEADIAFQNIGGIRSDIIKKGNITKKQILELSPFGNTYLTYDLNLKQIKSLIKYAYNLHHQNELQVSGININITIDKDLNLKNIELLDYQGRSLEKKIYKVALNDYMAASYRLRFLQSGLETNVNDAETLIKFISKKKTIDYKDVSRVNFKIE